MSGAVSRETVDRPAPGDPWPPVAALDTYAELLAGAGVERGLIGPNEVPRLWARHLLNCAAVALEPGLIPQGATVIDVGSGAGLPGLVWSLLRPDLKITLVDSLLRRCEFLAEAIALLGLQARVQIARSRAEDQVGMLRAQIVTARAVAPLERLVGWTLPLTEIGGQVLAIKGDHIDTEIEAAQAQLQRHGAGAVQILRLDRPGLERPTTVLAIPRLR